MYEEDNKETVRGDMNEPSNVVRLLNGLLAERRQLMNRVEDIDSQLQEARAITTEALGVRDMNIPARGMG